MEGTPGGLKAQLRARLQRALRGPGPSRLLASLGVDPRRFWILIDLFSMLSARKELSNWGKAAAGMKFGARIWFVACALGSLTALFAPPVTVYLMIWLVVSAIVLNFTLFFETAAVLINPTEGMILANLPINGATYTAAKLSHLFRIVLLFGIIPNLLPAVMGAIGLKRRVGSILSIIFLRSARCRSCWRSGTACFSASSFAWFPPAASRECYVKY